jgi:hypothetical protein
MSAPMPSNQKWFAVTTITHSVTSGCSRASHRQRLGLTRTTASPIRNDHPTCTDGIAAYSSPKFAGSAEYTDWW